MTQDARRREAGQGRWIRGAIGLLLAGAIQLSARAAAAQQQQIAPIVPLGAPPARSQPNATVTEAPPSPAVPLFGDTVPPAYDLTLGNGYQSGTPFSEFLPPSVTLPPVAPVVPATPPPPNRPAPFVLPEQGAGPKQPAGGLRQALSEYDRRLGLGAGGPIETATESIAMSGLADGQGLLDVQADASGHIRRAVVVSTTGKTDAWNELASQLRSVRVRGLRLPTGARGVWLRLDVDAETRSVSGRRPGHVAWYPGTVIAFDTADWAGAPPQRVVHSNVVSEVWY